MNEIIGANRRNVYIGARQKKQVQRAIVLQILPQVRSVEKPMRGKVLAKVRFFEPNERRDEDNVISGLKFIMDALQDVGLIEDDSRKFIHVLPEVFTDREWPRIEIDLF